MQLRAGVAQLSQALSRAELQPGDIVIRDGAPVQLVVGQGRAFSGSRAVSPEARKLAVALQYDRPARRRVVAKGKGSIGDKIVEVARAHDIPIEENEVLAGALSNVELGDEIPAELYKAVAEVLIFVLRLSGRIREGGDFDVRIIRGIETINVISGRVRRAKRGTNEPGIHDHRRAMDSRPALRPAIAGRNPSRNDK